MTHTAYNIATAKRTILLALAIIGAVIFWLIICLLVAVSLVYAADRVLPDPMLTPGVVREDLSVMEICAIKWGKDKRAVTASMKKQVFARYGLKGNTCKADSHGRHCEIDHLISRELGGADDILNLWPQAYGTKPWNAGLKDRLENQLHKEVCAGSITLDDAQNEIRTDWTVPYQRYFGKP